MLDFPLQLTPGERFGLAPHRSLTAETSKIGPNGFGDSKGTEQCLDWIEKDEAFQVNNLIYSMGDEAEGILHASVLLGGSVLCYFRALREELTRDRAVAIRDIKLTEKLQLDSKLTLRITQWCWNMRDVMWASEATADGAVPSVSEPKHKSGLVRLWST